MFTWAYNQLSTSWENALTDSDGAYAELMAGSYSDNQPDFAWIAPYETKRFSQYWYPIGDLGIPCFANLNGAVHWDGSGLKIQMTRDIDAVVTVTDNRKVVFRQNASFQAGVPACFECSLGGVGYSVRVTSESRELIYYMEEEKDIYHIPDHHPGYAQFQRSKKPLRSFTCAASMCSNTVTRQSSPTSIGKKPC